MIIIPFLNGYFIGGIPHVQTYPNHRLCFEKNQKDAIVIDLISSHDSPIVSVIFKVQEVLFDWSHSTSA